MRSRVCCCKARFARSGDSRVNQSGIVSFDVFRPQPPFFHGAGFEVLDQYVSVIEQLAQDLAPFLGAQVQSQ